MVYFGCPECNLLHHLLHACGDWQVKTMKACVRKKKKRKTKGERLLSHFAKSAARLQSRTLQGSSVTLLSVCLCHVQCVHSCTMGLLNQPTLLNIDGLFTQERCAAGSS